jgi:hypothetical protein
MDPISHVKSLTQNAFLAETIFLQLGQWFEGLMKLKGKIENDIKSNDKREYEWDDVMTIFRK